MNKVTLFLVLFCTILSADEVYNLNKSANRLYAEEKYAEALELYNKALEISPTDPNLLSNKGAALFKLGDPEKSTEAYKSAVASDTSKSRSDIQYNLGNALDLYGNMLAQKGDQSAMEKYKEAKQSYIKSLDANSKNSDAKWNLQIINEKIKQMEQQQQNQDNKDQKNDDQNKDQENQDQQNKDKQNKDDQKNKDQKDKENKDDQKNDEQQKDEDKKSEEEKEKEQEQQQQDEQNKKDEQEPPKPQPSEPQESKEEKMEKEEALRLLLQYADDDELNKPTKKMKARPKGSQEKDW